MYDKSSCQILVRDWNLSQVSCLWPHVDSVIEDPIRRTIVKEVLSSFEEDVLKNESKFSKGRSTILHKYIIYYCFNIKIIIVNALRNFATNN